MHIIGYILYVVSGLLQGTFLFGEHCTLNVSEFRDDEILISSLLSFGHAYNTSMIRVFFRSMVGVFLPIVLLFFLIYSSRLVLVKKVVADLHEL